MRYISYLFSYFILTNPFAQSIPNKSVLSIQEIMKGNEYIGNQPENIRWSADGQHIFFDWNPTNEPGNSIYQVNLSTMNQAAQKADLTHVNEYDPKQHRFLSAYYSIGGALWVYEKGSGKSTVVYQTADPVINVQRVVNPNLVFFQQGKNLFCYNVTTASIVQQTNFMTGLVASPKKDSTFLMKEEYYLFDAIREQKKLKDWTNLQNRKRNSFPKSFDIEQAQLEQLQVSPDAHFITFRLSTYSDGQETKVQHHITADGHTAMYAARPKVGIHEPSHRLGIYDIIKDSVYFVNFSNLSAIRKKPLYLNDSSDYPKDRVIIPHSFKFSEKGEQAVCDVRSYDNKDRWIVLIDLKSGNMVEIDHQHDDAWIGGPGIFSWDESEGTLGWLNNGKSIFYQSEVTGYSHLYMHHLDSKLTEQVTNGNWEVHAVQLSHDGTKFYISANKTHPGNRDFYHYDIPSGKLIPILLNDGYHDVQVSPDEKTLAVRYSFTNKPWELYVAPNRVSSKLKQLTHSTKAEFEKYSWREPQIVTFKARDGENIYARLYNPGANEIKNNAAIIFVHGAGYLQNVHHYWSNYYREFMFHNLLVDNGFTVLDIDYRGSEGYGRNYRTAIYRNMGGPDLQDQIDGKNWLIQNVGIDSNRIGIYGGSYGGFITLMAMLKTPNEFTCGAALRSVTDWAHYNTDYTANILNFPETDPESYRKCSPIYYAQNLKGRLLMLHGMVDDNVQFQDVVRMSERFIELGKDNWDLTIYPTESHGFKKKYSWYDEYRRIYELFYQELIMKKQN